MDNIPSHSQNTNRNNSSLDISEVELIYLIAKYLSVGPCKKSYEVLKAEIEENKILPKRTDWIGNEHERTYNDFDSQNSHIAQDFLLQVVSRLEPTIHKLWPTFPARKDSLLGRGSQSLLRSDRDSEKSYRTLSDVLVRQRGNLNIEPTTLKGTPNATQGAISREICGSTNRKHFLTNKLYSRLQLFVRNVGHLSAVYCMLFDRCGRYIITGADDMLVKIWSVIDGRLVATLRGASAEISDLALDQENTLIAAGSCDKIIRVWSLQTLAPVAVLSSHTGMITALQFCPKPDRNGILVSTGGDGCVAFWTYTRRNLEVKFDPKPLKLNERVRPGHAQLICASFSTGGNFLAVGGADHFVRVYKLGGSEGIDKLLETEIHTDRVDSIQWCHSGVGFVSGSRDGTALIWRFQCQEWKTTLLNMRQTLTGLTTMEEDSKKLQVTMVGWDRTDSLVITASSDHLLRVWDSRTGVLKRVLEGHEDNAYVIEAHPTDNRLILTAGHDGLLFIWDVIAGIAVKRFKNSIEGQGHGALFDAKWSPDGLGIATTDSHGHILTFGIGDNELFKKIPQELFFHTDYRPLVRDQNHHVLDEQTQMAPHLMPPPFLVNIDGDPYPPEFQRLVPGRENCRMDQLIPNVVTNDNGDQEVLDLGVLDFEPPPPPLQVRQNESNNREVLFGRPNIDDMIERLAQEQQGRRGPSERGGRDEEPGPSNSERRGSTSGGGAYPDHSYAVAPGYDPLSPRAGRVGARREGDIEGVRQSTGNWQRDPHMKWKRQLCLVPLTDGALEQSVNIRRAHGELELTLYEEEEKKGPDTPQLKGGEEEGGERESRRYRRRQKKPHASSKASKVTPPKTRRGRQGAGRGRPPGRQSASRASVPTAQSTFGDDFEDPDAAIASQEREEEGELEEEEEEEEEAALSLSSSSSSSSLAKEALEEEEESSSEDSDNSTDYSDWTADFGGAGLEPPKRTAHKQKRNPVPVKRKKRRAKKEEESEEEVEREEKEEKKVKRERRKRVEKDEEKRPSNARRKRDARNMNLAESDGDGGDIDEIPPEYRPPEWLGETVPKKAPYFPQMGDEIMYFRQGHQLYVEAVLNRQLYQVDKRSLPWIRKHNLRDQEYVKIIGIKYEIKPPRLCCLKLGIMDLDGNLTGDAFTIKYHDMPDVLDFLVLKSTYDAAVIRNWQVGDRFRCIIDDAWWIGTVEAQEPHLPEFPDSMFMCYRVLWDNGERERLSPWDMEFIEDQMKLPDIGGSIRVCSAEYKNLVYTPSPEEWAGSSFESECQRMAEGIGKLMELAVAEPFLTPVDLNVYPNYAMIVEYPMDLSTIKSRLESHFYRRPNAAQFDVRYIATNAEKFNKKGTVIVKHARIITDLALRLIKDPTCRDPTIYYHEVQNSYQSPSHSEDDAGTSRRLRQDSEEEKTRRRTSGRTKEALRSPRDGTIVLPKLGDNRPWQQQCRDLLKSMFERQDSTPFRFPVDVNRYEDYYQVIDVPMDLSTIREELAAGGYASPLDFAKDVRLVFLNSKTYNTNNKSRIYSMTVRLEAFFEDQIKGIFARCKNKEDSRTSSPLAGPSGSGTDLLTTRMNGGRHYDDSDEDDNDDKLRGSVNEGGKRRSRRVAKLRQLRTNDSDYTDSLDEEYSPQKRSPQKARDKTISSKTHSGSSKASQGRKSVSPATAVEKREKGGPVKRTSARKARGSDSDFEAPVKRSASSAPTLRPKRSRRYEEDSDFETNSPPSPPPEPSSEGEEEEKEEEESKWKVRQRRTAQKPSPTVSHRSLRGSTKRYVKSETSSGNEDVVGFKQNGEGGHSIGSFKRRIESSDEEEEEEEAVVNGIKEDSTWSIVKREDEDEDEEEEEDKRSEEEESGAEEEEENGTESKNENESEDEESDEKDEEIKQPPETTQKLRLTLASFRGRKKIEESEFECDDEELEDESEDEEEADDEAEKKKKGGQRGRKGGVPRKLRPKPVDGDDVEEDVDFVADFIDDEEVSSTSSTDEDSEDNSDSKRKKKSRRKKMTQKEKEKKEEQVRKERVKRARALARERAKATKSKAKALEKAKKARQKAKEKEKAKKTKEEAKRQAKAAKEANLKVGKGGRKKGSKDQTVTINSKVNFTAAVTGQLHHSPMDSQVPHPSIGPQQHYPTASSQFQPALTHQVQMRIAPQMSHVSQGCVNLQVHHTPISPHHIRPINAQVRHVSISPQMHQSSIRAQIYHSPAPSQMYQTTPPPQIQYSSTTSRIHQAQVVAPLIQAPVVQQQFIVPANTYTSPMNAYNSLPSYVPIAPNLHQPALIGSTATSQLPPPSYSSPPSLTQIPLTFDSRTQAKQVIHGGRVIGTKITQIGPISGSSGVVSGLSGIATGSSGVVTGSPVVVTGSSGVVTGSSGIVTGSSGVTGSSEIVTGSSGVDTGSSVVVTGSSGAATGFSGIVTESSSSSSDDDEDFEPGSSYTANGSWSRTRTRRGRIEEDSEEDEVGKRGRVRKKVRYNEDSEEGEASNSVSSRGRVRRANTRMIDFI